jgi:transcriptional regulator with PAS, ATPase and Fis domain
LFGFHTRDLSSITVMDLETANRRMQELYRISVERIARSDATVLIQGESGTGKERMARLLHQYSLRKEGPLVKVNCAALPEGVLESELFGHERGAFTGATARRIGRFEAAHNGTIFLDEVADLTPLVQAKLLRVLQEREIERVGGSETIRVDVRIIAATNKPLEVEVKNGRFRDDLYYRLNVINITLPPLRERPEDIPLLTDKFLEKFCARNQREPLGISAEVLDCFQRYHWPGNVRELENLIERLSVLTAGDIITLDDLPQEILESGEETSLEYGDRTGKTLSEAKAEFERGIIEETLARHKGNVTASSNVLGIARKNLQQKIRRYKIEVERFRGRRTDKTA